MSSSSFICGDTVRQLKALLKRPELAFANWTANEIALAELGERK